MKTLSGMLRKAAEALKDPGHWVQKILEEYGIRIDTDEKNLNDDPVIIRQIYAILKKMPPELVKSCGVKKLIVRTDLGPNKSFFPNHGYFVDDLVALNENIFYHPDEPDDFKDEKGYSVSRPEQTLIHELGHGYDEQLGNLALKDDWLSLSGWSEKPKKGLKKMVIKDPGTPQVVGEWFYDPKAGFTRFYAKRNPWDDFADSITFYICGLKSKLPDNKIKYFDKLLAKYN